MTKASTNRASLALPVLNLSHVPKCSNPSSIRSNSPMAVPMQRHSTMNMERLLVIAAPDRALPAELPAAAAILPVAAAVLPAAAAILPVAAAVLPAAAAVFAPSVVICSIPSMAPAIAMKRTLIPQVVLRAACCFLVKRRPTKRPARPPAITAAVFISVPMPGICL